MKTWVITGGAGSGKSSLVRSLRALLPSAGVFSADLAVSEALGCKEVIEKLLTCFGPAVEVAPGVVNRPWLRDFVLGDPVRRKKLEAILHPPVLEALEAGRECAHRSGTNLFLAEVPLHYEIGSTVSADLVIVVASSRSVQVRRMMETRGLDEQTVHKFLDAQWPIEAKVERADAVIWNDGSPASLEAQVLTLASPLLLA